MNITKAIATGRVLTLEIDGHPAYVEEPKLTLLEQGIVVLLDTDGHWQALTEPFDTEEGQVVPIAGGTRDPQVIALVRRFVDGEVGNLLEA